MDAVPAQILEAVKTDDIKLFSALTEQKKGFLALSFGRFPILSLCYLYKSYKIIAAYERLLLQIVSYIPEEEDFASYKRFFALAKTRTRLYRGKDAIVTPLEMLAVLCQTYKLTELYNKTPHDAKITENIAKIYRTLHNTEVKTAEGKLQIKRNKLSTKARAAIAFILIFAIIMVALPSAALANVTLITGDGTPENPYKITGEAQLISAFAGGDSHYKLTRDIVLASDWETKDFAGNLDGQGHTINLADKAKSGFIGVLSGNIANIRFVFSPLEHSIDTNLGMIVTNITGSAANIDIELDASFSESVSDKNIYVSCFALENSGTITNITLSGDISFEGNEEANAYFAGIVAWNRGTVDSCRTSADSIFEMATVHPAGLATENGATGTIKNCTNNADILQTTPSEAWSPNSAGIALINLGTIDGSVNNGKIASTSLSQTAYSNMYAVAGGIACTNKGSITNCNNLGEVFASAKILLSYAGGIACTNEGSVTNCNNLGEIFASSEILPSYAGGVVGINSFIVEKSKNDAGVKSLSNQRNAYAGGITAYNNTQDAKINNCCSYGLITINYEVYPDESDYLSFAGGLCGRNDGVILDSYSCASFAVEGEGGSNFYLAGIAGISYYAATLTNNYYLARSNIGLGVASTFAINILGQLIMDAGNDNGITLLSGIEQIKELEVYWG